MADPIPLLILPGHLCNERIYRPQIAALAGVAACAVADLGQDDTLAGMAARAVAPMPARFALAANSMGGAVAFEIMRKHPGRVRGLALIGTTARPEWAAQGARRALARAAAERGDWASVRDINLPAFFYPHHPDLPALSATLLAMFQEVGLAALIHQQQAFAARPDSRRDLPAIRCPTLVLVGQEDAITPPAMATEIADGIPGARLVTLAACGHIPMLERAADTTAALRAWLAALD